MGAWGEHNFENDDALDWVYELEVPNDLSVVAKTLEAVAEFGSEDYLEAPDAARALAAADVIAALLDRPSRDLPIEVKQWIDGHRSERPETYIPIALVAIERIRSNSEMKELWGETDNLSIW